MPSNERTAKSKTLEAMRDEYLKTQFLTGHRALLEALAFPDLLALERHEDKRKQEHSINGGQCSK